MISTRRSLFRALIAMPLAKLFGNAEKVYSAKDVNFALKLSPLTSEEQAQYDAYSAPLNRGDVVLPPHGHRYAMLVYNHWNHGNGSPADDVECRWFQDGLDIRQIWKRSELRAIRYATPENAKQLEAYVDYCRHAVVDQTGAYQTLFV